MFRRQLPVYSPLPFTAVAAAIGAKLGFARGAEKRIVQVLQHHYRPQKLLLTASGTTALELAVVGSVATRGGAVAMPAYGCYDLATAADGADVPVVLYDIDPSTLGPELRSLERGLAQGALTVVVPHLYGIPVDMAEVRRIVEAAGALLIEDAAQAIGATFRGRPIGTLGSLTVLSFGRGKGVTAGGGGALLANDEAGLRSIEWVVRNGIGRGTFPWSNVVALMAQWFLGRPSLYGVPASVPMLHLGETLYKAPRARSGLGTPACAVLSVTWPFTVAEVDRRSLHARRLISRLSAKEGVQAIACPKGAEPSYLRLPIVMSSRRSEADEPRARELGIAPGYPKSLADLEGFRHRCRNASTQFTGARELARRLVTMPTHSRLSEQDMRALEAWIDRVFGTA